MSQDPQSPAPGAPPQPSAPTFVQPSPGAPPVALPAPWPPAPGQPAPAQPAPYLPAPHPGAAAPPYGRPDAAPPETGTPAARSASLGLVSLIVALVAVVVSIVLSGATGLAAAEGAVRHATGFTSDDLPYLTEDELLGLLSPVRGLVLWAEIGYWLGTLLGLAALGLGIAAIATRRGRGQGIAAVIIAGVGPFLYAVLVGMCLVVGIGAGAS